MAKTKPATDMIASPDYDKEWRAESDLRTLIDAEKIKADKPRLKAAMAKRDEQSKALAAIQQETKK